MVAKAWDTPLPDLPSHTELIQWQHDIDSTGYWSALSILWQGHIRPTAGPLGVAANVPEVEITHRSACFSETRLDKLARLIATRSLYGVGFTQDVLAAAGGRPVRYLRTDRTEAATRAADIRERQHMGVDPSDGFWRETPFIEASEDNGWEEEWRVPGGFDFVPDQVAFVFIPEDLHEQARAFFEEHRQAGSGPAYLCPYIDPTWDHAHLQEALSARALPTPRSRSGGPSSR